MNWQLSEVSIESNNGYKSIGRTGGKCNQIVKSIVFLAK